MKENIKNYILKIKDIVMEAKSNLKNMEDTKCSIDEAQAKKTNLLLQMGMLTYKMIRENRIDDEIFNSLSEEILELDKFIYKTKLELDIENDTKGELVCECGNTIECSDKFCSECGNEIENQVKHENTIVCQRCECNIDLDSVYCTCCGNKIL